jgi:hypothetical protein
MFQAMKPANHPFQLYTTFEQAVRDLAKGLAKMRALLSEPQVKKARE